ncbi:A/G-specific adenine glycosylase [Flagellimonas sp. HMM57]|uniref:A/G-specific adenine glycosylase n=1 Tax=unclassified Flagellimonas TaxID=2644544 RepID=UPI0013D433A8|nr:MULTISPECIES: A/G-specific adenine glycosylase [unclassified Flagellimonas]UII74495.1 A/G-specific adenine glycosylase [Flagellimonas sp. HMM57]
MSFSQKILKWYGQHKRELPWRTTNDPYKIWLSEIMLQQTRVAQGMPYYHKFLEAFPTVYDLANADEEQVLKLWQGLGYYSRARNLHATAKMVVTEHGGHFPNTYEELKSLKGVGDYTASAIASICFNEPEPVVDGNVYRVLARYFGVDLPINSTTGVKYFKKLARDVMNSENIRDYNQGIMEFGAIQCAPKKPYCLLCPLNDSCVALQENKVGALPVKLKNAKIKNRFFNYLIFLDDKKQTLLEQRKGKGIWQNLYQFPLVESHNVMNISELKEQIGNHNDFPDYAKVLLYNEQPIVHKLSHQHLHTRFWILQTKEILKDGISWGDIISFPVPVLIADFIKTYKI